MTEEYDYLFKCIVVGDGGVGKTAITIRFSKGFFTEDYKMTIGVDFHVKTIAIDTEQEGPIKVKLQIWDTGGQERFSSIRPMYYRGSLGSLLIFDLTSYESFEHLPQWIEEVRANVKSDIPLLLVGNKSDLIEQRAVSMEEINNFTRTFNLYYMETSAKTGDKVGDCFYILACLMVGSGVPEKLISQGVVFGPGQISIMPVTTAPALKQPAIKPEVTFTPAPVVEPEYEKQFIAPPVPEPVKKSEPEPEFEFAAPPVPERQPKIPSTIQPISVKEPEFEFAAPPVPEKEPEIEFAAPPVPEPKPIKMPGPIPESKIPHITPKGQAPLKEPSIYAYKPPEQALPTSVPAEEKTPSYKPKTIPFTSSIPIPAPAPQEFKTSEKETESESLVDYMPETILSKKEIKRMEKQKKKEEKEKALQEKREKAAKLKEEMQSVGKQEKEKAKLEKEKAKQEKEKAKLDKQKEKEEKEKALQEKREKAAKLKEDMQKVGKEKKKEVEEPVSQPFVIPQQPFPEKSKSETPNLFERLSKKTDQIATPQSAQFIPFGAKQTSSDQEPSKLKIIPNIADLEERQGQVPSQKPSTGIFENYQQKEPLGSTRGEIPATRKSNMVICPQCGAMLSSEYAFCNKCGSKI
jgi:Ras-related protein Rab-11A